MAEWEELPEPKRHPEDRPGGQVYPKTEHTERRPLIPVKPTPEDEAWIEQIVLPRLNEYRRLAREDLERRGYDESLCDLEHPDPARRLTHEQSMRLIEERYGEALKKLAEFD